MVFEKCVRTYPEEQWIEVVIDPTIVLFKKCWFYYRNAASANFSDVNDNTQAKDFEDMFLDHLEYKTPRDVRSFSRKKLNLRSFETTEPQAEIIIEGVIEPSFIQSFREI